MSRFIQRQPITALLLTTLRASNRQVGDAEMPKGGVAGWIGQPASDGTNFVPYSVLTPTAGQAGGGPLTEPGSDPTLGYTISSFGVSRVQCEDQADLMRLALHTLVRATVPQWAGTDFAYNRRVQVAQVTGYGPVQRIGDAGSSNYYASTDSIALITTG